MMKSFQQLGVGAGGCGFAWIAWNIGMTWDEQMTEKIIYGLIAILAAGVILIISYLFSLAREKNEKRERAEGGWGGEQMVDGYGRPMQYNAQAAPIVLHSTGRGRGGRTEIIVPPAGGWQGPPMQAGGWQPPVQTMYPPQGYGQPMYGPPPGGQNGFGGGYPGYPQPGAQADNEGSFRDASGGNVW